MAPIPNLVGALSAAVGELSIHSSSLSTILHRKNCHVTPENLNGCNGHGYGGYEGPKEEAKAVSGLNPEATVGVSVGVIMGGFVLLVIGFYGSRMCYRLYRRRNPATYITLQTPRNESRSWPRPPTTYQQNGSDAHIGEHVIQPPPRAAIAARYHELRPMAPPRRPLHVPIIVQGENNEDVAIRNQALVAVLSSTSAPRDNVDAVRILRQVATQREAVIQMDRQRALLKLEGHPHGGRHMEPNETDSESYNKFKAQVEARQNGVILEDVDREPKKPEPARLRGGGSEDIYFGSADDITRRIKHWFKETAEDTRESIKRRKQHREWIKEQESRQNGSGLLPGFLRKLIERKKEEYRVRDDRDDTLAILGRSSEE